MFSMSPAQIEREASALSNFGGFSGYDEAALDNFLGYDDALDFDGDDSLGFAGEGVEPRQFAFTVDSNESANVCRFFIISGTKTWTPKVVPLPSSFGSISSGAYPVTGTQRVVLPAAPNGLIFDGQFIDKDGLVTQWDSTHGLTATSASVGTIAMLQAYLMENPTRLREIKIVSTDINQLQYDLTIRKLSPFKTLEERQLHPANEQDQYVNQTTIVKFNCNEVLDANTQIEYAIAPSSTATITLYFGASENRGKGLQKRGNRAITNMATAGGNKGAILAALNRRIGPRR